MATITKTYTNSALSAITGTKDTRTISTGNGFGTTSLVGLLATDTVGNIGFTYVNNASADTTTYNFTYILPVQFTNIPVYQPSSGAYVAEDFSKLYKITGNITLSEDGDYNLLEYASNLRYYYVLYHNTYDSGTTYEWVELTDNQNAEEKCELRRWGSISGKFAIKETHFQMGCVANNTFYDKNMNVVPTTTIAAREASIFQAGTTLDSTTEEINNITATTIPVTYSFSVSSTTIGFTPYGRTTSTTPRAFTGHTTTCYLKPYKDASENDFPSWCYNDIINDCSINYISTGNTVSTTVACFQYSITVSSPGCTFYKEKNSSIGSTPYNSVILNIKPTSYAMMLTAYGEVSSVAITYYVCYCENGYDGTNTSSSNNGYPYIISDSFLSTSYYRPRTNINFLSGTIVLPESDSYTTTSTTIDGYNITMSNAQNVDYGSSNVFIISNAPVGGFSTSSFSISDGIQFYNSIYKFTGNITIIDKSATSKLFCIHCARTDNTSNRTVQGGIFDKFAQHIAGYYHYDIAGDSLNECYTSVLNELKGGYVKNNISQGWMPRFLRYLGGYSNNMLAVSPSQYTLSNISASRWNYGQIGGNGQQVVPSSLSASTYLENNKTYVLAWDTVKVTYASTAMSNFKLLLYDLQATTASDPVQQYWIAKTATGAGSYNFSIPSTGNWSILIYTTDPDISSATYSTADTVTFTGLRLFESGTTSYVEGTNKVVQYSYLPGYRSEATGVTTMQSLFENYMQNSWSIDYDEYPYVGNDSYGDGQCIMRKDLLLGSAPRTKPTVTINSIGSRRLTTQYAFDVSWTETSNDYNIDSYIIEVASDSAMTNVVLSDNGTDNAVTTGVTTGLTTTIAPISPNTTYYTRVTIVSGTKMFYSNVMSAQTVLNSYITTSAITTTSAAIIFHVIESSSSTISMQILDSNNNIVYDESFQYTYTGDYYEYTQNVEGLLPQNTYKIYMMNLTTGKQVATSSFTTLDTPVDLTIEYAIPTGTPYVSDSDMGLFCLTRRGDYKTENITNSFKYIKILDNDGNGTWDYTSNYVYVTNWSNFSSENSFIVQFSIEPLENTYRTIHHYAFSKNEYIRDISILASSRLQTIGRAVFDYCKNLEGLNIDNNLESIGKGCFQSCERLVNANLPTTLVHISHNAFQNCINLDSTVICASLNNAQINYIGRHAFERCGYEYHNIPASQTIAKANTLTFSQLEYLGDSAFYWSYLFGSFDAGAACKRVGAYAFGNCNSLSRIDLYYDYGTLDYYYYPGILSRSEVTDVVIHELYNGPQTGEVPIEMAGLCLALKDLEDGREWCNYDQYYQETDNYKRYAFIIGNISNNTDYFGHNSGYATPNDAYQAGSVQQRMADYPRPDAHIPSPIQMNYSSAIYMIYKCFLDTEILRGATESSGIGDRYHSGQLDFIAKI